VKKLRILVTAVTVFVAVCYFLLLFTAQTLVDNPPRSTPKNTESVEPFFKGKVVTSREYTPKPVVSVYKYHDGDTMWLVVDLDYRSFELVHVRLDKYDTPETNRGSVYEKMKGREAAEYTNNFIASALSDPESTLWIKSEPDTEIYGRWLSRIWRESPTGTRDLGLELRALSLASIYPTKWREEFDHTIRKDAR
jgi:hypothetical protein